jgi:hypothetical protein
MALLAAAPVLAVPARERACDQGLVWALEDLQNLSVIDFSPEGDWILFERSEDA